MKKLVFFCTLAAFALAGCDKDKDGDAPSPKVITAANVGGDIQGVHQVGIDLKGPGAVKAASAASIAVRADFVNGGFSLTLPAPLNDAYLATISAMFDGDDMSGLSISDAKVKVYGIDEEEFYAFDDSNTGIGNVYYGKGNDWAVGTARVGFIYVDRAVTLTGVVKKTKGTDDTFALDLKKGWNITHRERKADVSGREQFTISTTFETTGLLWKIIGKDSRTHF